MSRNAAIRRANGIDFPMDTCPARGGCPERDAWQPPEKCITGSPNNERKRMNREGRGPGPKGRNRPQLALHVPEPDARPGDEADFSHIPIPAAGSAPRP